MIKSTNGRFSTRYAALVLLPHHNLIAKTKLRLTLHIHAYDTTRVACTVLTTLCIPHFAVIVDAAEVFTVFAHLRLASRTAAMRFGHQDFVLKESETKFFESSSK